MADIRDLPARCGGPTRGDRVLSSVSETETNSSYTKSYNIQNSYCCKSVFDNQKAIVVYFFICLILIMKMLDWPFFYYLYVYLCWNYYKKDQGLYFFGFPWNSIWLFVSYNPQTFIDSVIHLTSMYIHMLVIINYSVFF